jgi:hypothetical protein
VTPGILLLAFWDSVINISALSPNLNSRISAYRAARIALDVTADSYTVVLSNEAHTVACDSAGTPIALELGATGKAKTKVTVYKGSQTLAVVATGTVPTAGQWRIESLTPTGCTAAFEAPLNDTIMLNTLTAESGSVALNIQLEGTTVAVSKMFSFSKAKGGATGAAGADGMSINLTASSDVIFANADGTGYTLPPNNEIKLYKGGVLLVTPAVSFSGTATKNGLTATVNATTGAVVYTGASWTTNTETFSFSALHNSVTYTIAYSITKSRRGDDVIFPDLASEADVISANVTGGGYTLPTGNVLYLYKGGTILGTGSITFGGGATKNGLTLAIAANGAITLSGASWTTDTESFSLTATYATVVYTAIYTISKSKTGATGAVGARNATIRLYRWDSSAPATWPSGDSLYTWATGAFVNPLTLNSWTQTPGSGAVGQTLYETRAYGTDSTTNATSTITWPTTGQVSYVVGVYGQTGVAGNYQSEVSVYYQGVSTPTAPTTTLGSYTFTGGVVVVPTGGGISPWVSTMPAASPYPTWQTTALFSTNTPGVAVAPTGAWSAPIRVAQNASRKHVIL